MYDTIVKRIIDFILSLIGLILLSPFFLIIAFCIKIDSPGPALFKQQRVGRNKKKFEIYKFRTMRIDTPAETPTHLFEKSNNFITRFGKILRKSSLDELPQLINIIKGDMALIGPRPALWNQYDLIEYRDKYGANDIRPGLTGWAQINGRDKLKNDVKAELDGYYVKNESLCFDIKCFFGTIATIIKSDGVIDGNKEVTTKKD